MTLYTLTSYKDVLRHTTTKPKTFQAMAAHCRVQKTYLSKVLNREGHLNEDQIYLALDYLGLAPDECEFTLLLHSLERSQLVPRRKQIEARVNALRALRLKTEAHLDVNRASASAGVEDLTEYYLEPYFQIIHMLLTLRRFQQNPMAVGEALGLPAAVVTKFLRGLERMRLIALTRTQPLQGRVLRDKLHLPQDSSLHSAYSARLRLKAIERMSALKADEGYSFSVLFSTDARVRQKIHSSFMEWLKDVQKMVQNGREEDVYQINFDLLNWT